MEPTRGENILDLVLAPEFLTELCFKFRSLAWDMILANLALIDWDNVSLNCGGTCEFMYDKFMDIFNNMIALYMPTCAKSRSNQKSPGFHKAFRHVETLFVQGRNYKIGGK